MHFCEEKQNSKSPSSIGNKIKTPFKCTSASKQLLTQEIARMLHIEPSVFLSVIVTHFVSVETGDIVDVFLK